MVKTLKKFYKKSLVNSILTSPLKECSLYLFIYEIR